MIILANAISTILHHIKLAPIFILNIASDQRVQWVEGMQNHSAYFSNFFGFDFFLLNASFNSLFLNIISFSWKYTVCAVSGFFSSNKFLVLTTTLLEVDFADVILLLSIDLTLGFFYSFTFELYKLLSRFSFLFLAVVLVGS